MNTNERDILIIEKILDYCTQISDTHNRFDDSFDRFDADFIYRNAICLCLLQIGELSIRLSDEFKDGNEDIPWRAIRGMRNMVAHEYGHIDVKTLWNTSHKHISELEEFCENVLANEDLSQDFNQTM